MRRAPLYAALATAALWTVKAVAIGVAGGLGRSPAEGPLFLAGLVACVVTVVLIGLAVTAGRSAGVRALGVAGAVVVASLLGTLEGLAVAAVTPTRPGWVWGELNLWILVAGLVAVTSALAVRRERVPLAVG